ncbi:MAG: hypothetical protein Q9208_003120 [Pyrenodesmia sp. 3 TL-2023]
MVNEAADHGASGGMDWQPVNAATKTPNPADTGSLPDAGTEAPSDSNENDDSCHGCGDDSASTEKMFMICCRREYCQECITGMFQVAVTTELLFPPKCCLLSVLSVQQVRHLLPQDVLDRYYERKKEWASPARIYCHKPTCSQFIGNRDVQDKSVDCPSCGCSTCVACTAAAHDGECLEDPTIASLKKLAAKTGYKPCPRCNRLVERNGGCSSIQ